MKLKVSKKVLYEASQSKRAIFDKVLEAMNKIAASLYTKEVMYQ